MFGAPGEEPHRRTFGRDAGDAAAHACAATCAVAGRVLGRGIARGLCFHLEDGDNFAEGAASRLGGVIVVRFV